MEKCRRITAFLLIIVLIFAVISLYSCARPLEYNEAEVLETAELLIKKSEPLNEIYYGRGISYLVNESTRDGNYYEADPIHLDLFGIETVDDIKRMTREVYSPSLAESMITATLGSINDGSNITSLARYYQKYSALDGECECIMVYKDATVFLVDTVEYDYSSLRVLGSDENAVKVEISALVTSSEGEEQTARIEISLVPRDGGGYLLDSHTYARYFDRDRYDELQNKK